MTSLNPSQTDMQRAIKGALNAHWRLLLFQGVIMIILGVAAIACAGGWRPSPSTSILGGCF